MASTPSTAEVMAETGPILSILPTSSSSALEKMARRREIRALAVQRYSASPVRSSAPSSSRAVSSAERTACPAAAAVIWGLIKSPRKPETIWAKAAVPTSVRSLSAVMRKIHPHRPLAIRKRVLLSKSIISPAFETWGIPVGKPLVSYN